MQIRFGRVVYAWISVTSNVARNKSLIRPYQLWFRPGLELKRSFFTGSNWKPSYRPKLSSRTGVGIAKGLVIHS